MEWNFDKLGKTLSQAGKEVSEKVKETAGIVQLKQRASAAESEADNLFKEIGRLFFEQHAEDAGEEFAELFAGVKAAKEKAAAAQAALLKIRGTKVCPECGAEIEYSAQFCSHCGTAVPVPEEPAEAPAETEEADEFEDAVPEEEDLFAGGEPAEETPEAAGETAEDPVQTAAEEAVEEAECEAARSRPSPSPSR